MGTIQYYLLRYKITREIYNIPFELLLYTNYTSVIIRRGNQFLKTLYTKKLILSRIIHNLCSFEVTASFSQIMFP